MTDAQGLFRALEALDNPDSCLSKEDTQALLGAYRKLKATPGDTPRQVLVGRRAQARWCRRGASVSPCSGSCRCGAGIKNTVTDCEPVHASPDLYWRCDGAQLEAISSSPCRLLFAQPRSCRHDSADRRSQRGSGSTRARQPRHGCEKASTSRFLLCWPAPEPCPRRAAQPRQERPRRLHARHIGRYLRSAHLRGPAVLRRRRRFGGR